MRMIHIDIGQVVEVLAGTYDHGGGEDAVLMINHYSVARVEGNRIVALACTYPRHGVRTELRPYEERMRMVSTRDVGCPVCGGAEWVDMGSPEAKQLTTMALCFELYRGIALSDRR